MCTVTEINMAVTALHNAQHAVVTVTGQRGANFGVSSKHTDLEGAAKKLKDWLIVYPSRERSVSDSSAALVGMVVLL